MLVVISGTINPNNSVPFLKLNSSKERLIQYEMTIRNLLNNKNISKVVFCDNSNYSFETKEFNELAQNQKKEFEYLTFCGNYENVKRFGKGYGEGELLKYVLDNSELLKNEKYFYKLTGRLILLNMDKIIKKTNQNINYFNKINFFNNNDKADTRFYGIKIEDYKRYFSHAYKKVDDYNGNYLEHVFYRIIKDNNIQHKNMPSYPRFYGISGSSGASYQLSKLSFLLKNICCKFGLAKIK